MQIPKIHFFIGDLRGGGAERALVEIVNRIDRSKFAITLVLIQKRGTYFSDLNQNIPVEELLNKKPISGKFYILRRLVQHIHRTQPDVMISFTTPIARFMLIAKLFCFVKTKYIVVEQNNVSLNIMRSYPQGINIGMQWFTKALYRSAHLVVAVSEGIKKNIIRDYGLDPNKCITIYNPVNISKVQRTAKQPVEHNYTEKSEKLIVAVGRLVPQKGYEDMLEVMHIVRQEVPCKLLILGEGRLRAALEEKISSLNLKDVVLMPGFMENPWSYLATSDVFLSTSYWEGFSLAHIEAMACGVPLVLTDCDYGPKELIDPEQNGVLVPVGNVSAIATRLIALLKNDDERVSIHENAASHITKFDSPVIAANYEKILDNLLTM